MLDPSTTYGLAVMEGVYTTSTKFVNWHISETVEVDELTSTFHSFRDLPCGRHTYALALGLARKLYSLCLDVPKFSGRRSPKARDSATDPVYGDLRYTHRLHN